MSYLVWRNRKIAIIIFVDNKNINPVIDKAKELISNQLKNISPVKKYDENWFNYIFNNGDGEIELALMLYHIPEQS